MTRQEWRLLYQGKQISWISTGSYEHILNMSCVVLQESCAYKIRRTYRNSMRLWTASRCRTPLQRRCMHLQLCGSCSCRYSYGHSNHRFTVVWFSTGFRWRTHTHILTYAVLSVATKRCFETSQHEPWWSVMYRRAALPTLAAWEATRSVKHPGDCLVASNLSHPNVAQIVSMIW